MVTLVKFEDVFPQEELNKNKRPQQSAGSLNVSDVLDKQIVIKNVSWETGLRGDAVLMLDTDLGVVRTGSKVLIKQIKLIEQKIAGKSLQTVIVQKLSKTGFKYFSFK